MKALIFFLSITLFVLFACTNNNAAKEKPNEITASSQTIAQFSYDTVHLTAGEIKDDSLDDAGYITGTTWEHAGINDSLLFKKFVKQLKIWTANGAKENIATLLDYPLSNPQINDEKDFIANYDKYFSDKLKKAVASQKLSQIYHDIHGIRTTNGELWFKKTDKGFKITAIND